MFDTFGQSWIYYYFHTYQVLRLHVEYQDSSEVTTKPQSDTATVGRAGRIALGSVIFAGAVGLTSIGVLVYLKRSKA